MMTTLLVDGAMISLLRLGVDEVVELICLVSYSRLEEHGRSRGDSPFLLSGISALANSQWSSLSVKSWKKFVEFLEEESQSGKHAIYPQHLFSLTVVNSLWKMINGTSFNLHNPKLNNLIRCLDDFTHEVSKVTVNLTMAYNSLEYIFEALGITRVFETWSELLDVGSETIAEHVENFDADAQPADYIDAYLARIHSETNPESSFFGKSGHLNLRSTLADVFFAGIETTTTTLTWAMLFMAKYTDVQLKVQEELDCVIGRGRLPNLSDRAFTPLH